MSDHWILKDKKPERVDLMTWARWFENGKQRIVAKTKVGDVSVSTVFLGIDHSFDGGRPLLFETMIFGGEHDQYQDRYSTYEEAEEGHKKAVALVES